MGSLKIKPYKTNYINMGGLIQGKKDNYYVTDITTAAKTQLFKDTCTKACYKVGYSRDTHKYCKSILRILRLTLNKTRTA